ncbi:SDR family oxidoreductase [Vibrio hippocampi]|uniref:SDR family oxidoreductase n=1 Tax=Vibrio hippocampi TaxID=654686 RepID=A0ABM8ZNN9_9VIBR|nr:SDR family oxidoreductase [Vibrio hippocampi]CAH0530269.1 hypothetical protein VHP8226_03931 [Vibrio hippocampi]
MNILILGASGAIGFALLQQTFKQFPDAKIWGTYHRSQPESATLDPESRVTWVKLDLTDERQIERLSSNIENLDWLINCVGILHNEQVKPEKSIGSFDGDFFMQNIQINTLPTLLLAKHFTPALKKSTHPRFAVISARVGSIEDNRLGGWYSYRSSKAALNMALKTLSIEWGRTVQSGVVLALHPGTTDSELSKPFQANVPQGKLFRPEKVACDIIHILQCHRPEASGQFIAYDGTIVPW